MEVLEVWEVREVLKVWEVREDPEEQAVGEVREVWEIKEVWKVQKGKYQEVLY